MKYDKLVNYDGRLMTARLAALKSGLAPSTVLKLASAGKPIVRQPREGREPRRALHDGRMLTAEEIAPLVGLSVVTVRRRMRDGKPLERIVRRGMVAELVEHDGRMVSIGQLAMETGQSTGKLYYRLKHGLPLTGPVKRKRRERRLTQSGEFRVSRARGENGLYWSDDLEARVWHLHCGGDNFGECTLAEIGALWDLSRERARQIVDEAVLKIRRAAAHGEPDALDALRWFKLRSEQRSASRPSVWEQAELNSPGYFDSGGRGGRAA